MSFLQSSLMVGRKKRQAAGPQVSRSIDTVLFLLQRLWKPVGQWTWAAEKRWGPFSLSNSLWSCQETKIHPRSYCSSLYERAQRLAEGQELREPTPVQRRNWNLHHEWKGKESGLAFGDGGARTNSNTA